MLGQRRCGHIHMSAIFSTYFNKDNDNRQCWIFTVKLTMSLYIGATRHINTKQCNCQRSYIVKPDKILLKTFISK